jgi:hypothetical protein
MGDILHHQIWTFVSLHLHDGANNHMWEVSNAAILFGLMFWLDPIWKMCLALENVPCVENKATLKGCYIE